MRFDKDLTRSMVEPILMSLVSERAMYGYEIIKLVNERTGGAFQWKEEYRDRIVEQMRRMGVSVDWTRERFTLDPDYCRAGTQQ